jgi:hypothetical protein
MLALTKLIFSMAYRLAFFEGLNSLRPSGNLRKGYYIYNDKSFSEGLHLVGLKHGRIGFLSPRNRKTAVL